MIKLFEFVKENANINSSKQIDNNRMSRRVILRWCNKVVKLIKNVLEYVRSDYYFENSDFWCSDVLFFYRSFSLTSRFVSCALSFVSWLRINDRDLDYFWLSHQMKDFDRCNNKRDGFTVGDWLGEKMVKLLTTVEGHICYLFTN